jgi:hypothetical protein
MQCVQRVRRDIGLKHEPSGLYFLFAFRLLFFYTLFSPPFLSSFRRTLLVLFLSLLFR